MSALFEPGEIVERYRIEAVLGDGGTARVYRVRHTTLGTVHALKVLTFDHPDVRARLIEEGKAQARLQHPNLVPVRDVLQVGESEALLMDFVPGRSMAEWIHQEPLDVVLWLELFRGVVAGVGYAHDEGVIHRDIKPANVLLDETGFPPVPRVADFGLVRLLDQTGDGTRRTRVGSTMGTLGYMAPEQLRDARNSDVRTDVFALGALLYAMLVGRPPFSGDDQVEIIQATTEGRYPSLAATMQVRPPSGLDDVIARCMKVDPADRYPDTGALLDALAQVAVSGAEKHIEDRLNAPTVTTGSWTESQGRGEIEEEVDGLGVAHATTVQGLIVDETGQGHSVRVRVALDPNGEGVQHAPGIARDAQVAAQLATVVALGAEAKQWGVRWTLEGFAGTLHGTSLGLPLAVAIWAARHDCAVPHGWVFTGGVDLDGQVAPVSGIPAKLRAASQGGHAQVAVPADGLGALDVPNGIQVVPCRTWDGLKERLFPEAAGSRTRGWNRRLLALIVPVIMAITGLTSAVEPLVHEPLLRWIHGALPADNTVILSFPPQRDARALREQHPAVIDRLVELGARTIFFDVTMTASTPHDDEIARAIRDAKAAGVTVVMPVVLEDDLVLFPESEGLREAARYGAVLANADTALWHVRRAPARVRTVNDGDHWHAAVLSVQGHLAVDADPRIEDGTLIVGPNRNPVWADLVYLHPTMPTPILSFDAPETWTEISGRTVLIGEMGGSDDLHRTDADTVYGVEIEAALIETLLQQRAPRLTSPEISALFALLVGLFTALVGGALPRSRRWIAAVVPLGAITVAIVLVVAGVLISVLPMLTAALFGAWSIRRAAVTPENRHP